jgi:hypothetical protein
MEEGEGVCAVEMRDGFCVPRRSFLVSNPSHRKYKLVLEKTTVMRGGHTSVYNTSPSPTHQHSISCFSFPNEYATCAFFLFQFIALV